MLFEFFPKQGVAKKIHCNWLSLSHCFLPSVNTLKDEHAVFFCFSGQSPVETEIPHLTVFLSYLSKNPGEILTVYRKVMHITHIGLDP